MFWGFLFERKRETGNRGPRVLSGIRISEMNGLECWKALCAIPLATALLTNCLVVGLYEHRGFRIRGLESKQQLHMAVKVGR